MLADLRDLFLPERCIECGIAPSLWCEPCRGRLTPCVMEIAKGCRLLALSHANPTMMRAVSMWKDSGITQFSSIFASDIAKSIERDSAETAADIVTIPTRTSSRRRRGYEPMVQLANAVCGHHAGQWQVRTDVLRWKAQPGEQRGRTDQERATNVNGRMVATPGHTRNIVLLDDVVTSGSTVAEALRALGESGHSVGLVVALAMPRKSLSQDLVKPVAQGHRAV